MDLPREGFKSKAYDIKTQSLINGCGPNMLNMFLMM